MLERRSKIEVVVIIVLMIVGFITLHLITVNVS